MNTKKIFNLFVLSILIVTICSCSHIQPLNEDQIRDSLSYIDLPIQDYAEISEFKVIKQQDAEKESTVFCNIIALNDDVEYHLSLELTYVFYDKGGWILEELTPFSQESWYVVPLRHYTGDIDWLSDEWLSLEKSESIYYALESIEFIDIPHEGSMIPSTVITLNYKNENWLYTMYGTDTWAFGFEYKVIDGILSYDWHYSDKTDDWGNPWAFYFFDHQSSRTTTWTSSALAGLWTDGSGLSSPETWLTIFSISEDGNVEMTLEWIWNRWSSPPETHTFSCTATLSEPWDEWLNGPLVELTGTGYTENGYKGALKMTIDVLDKELFGPGIFIYFGSDYDRPTSPGGTLSRSEQE